MKLQCYKTSEIELRAAVANMRNLFSARVERIHSSHFSWWGT